MAVAEKEVSLEHRFLEEQSLVSSNYFPNPEASSVWLSQETVPYHRSDGVAMLLTYDIYSCLFGPGKKIYQLRYQSNLIPLP